jgi:hypothetical protein
LHGGVVGVIGVGVVGVGVVGVMKQFHLSHILPVPGPTIKQGGFKHIGTIQVIGVVGVVGVVGVQCGPIQGQLGG